MSPIPRVGLKKTAERPRGLPIPNRHEWVEPGLHGFYFHKWMIHLNSTNFKETYELLDSNYQKIHKEFLSVFIAFKKPTFYQKIKFWQNLTFSKIKTLPGVSRFGQLLFRLIINLFGVFSFVFFFFFFLDSMVFEFDTDCASIVLSWNCRTAGFVLQNAVRTKSCQGAYRIFTGNFQDSMTF